MPVYEKDGTVLGAKRGSALESALIAEGWRVQAEKPAPKAPAKKPQAKKPA